MDRGDISGLRRTHGYVNFFAAATSARIADEMLSVAVVLHVLDRTGSAIIAGATLACVTFPSLITAPLLGGWLDLTGRRRFAMICDQLLAASGLTLLLLLPGTLPDAAIPALGVVIGLTYPLSFGGFTSLIPVVVPDDLLAPANALEATSFNTAMIAGPALAGTIVAAYGPAEAVTVEIALTLAALALILRIPGLDRPPRRDYGSLAQIVRAGLLHLVRTPPLLGATLIGGIGLAGLGLLTVAFPFFAVDHLDAGRGAAGYLWAAFACGSAIGAIAFTGLQRRFAPERIMVVAIGALGLIMLTWPVAQSLPVAMVLIGLGGLADGPALASTFAVRQQHTPRRLHGQVMTTAVGVKIGMLALGAGSAGVLLETLDASAVVMIAAAIQLVAVCVGWLTMRAGARSGATVARAPRRALRKEALPDFAVYLADAPDGACRLKLTGEFDISGRELADEVLASADASRKIVLDLSELEFIDSMGIHFVVTAHQAAQAEGREFAIVRGGPEVNRIFELVGLGDVLPFEDVA